MNHFFKEIPSPLGKLILTTDQTGEKLQCLSWNQIRIIPGALETAHNPLLNKAELQLNRYFDRDLETFDLPLHIEGTDFQKKVWAALQNIPYGETWSYGQLAKVIGSPQASRAVGMANGRNSLPIIVPCHRVIGSSGKLVGFTGGLNIKVYLLELEKSLSLFPSKGVSYDQNFGLRGQHSDRIIQ